MPSASAVTTRCWRFGRTRTSSLPKRTDALIPPPLPLAKQPCGPLRLVTVFGTTESGGAPQECCAKGVEILKEAGGPRAPPPPKKPTPPPPRPPPPPPPP